MILAILNIDILTLDRDRRIIKDGVLIIRDDRIEAVGGAKELTALIDQADQTIEGRGMVALPGLVNAHTHSFQSLLRGLADGMDLTGFLRKVIYQVSPVISIEEQKLGAALSALEAIKSGTTCLIDNHSADTGYEATNGIAQAFDESGLRCLVARGFRQPTPRARLWNIPDHVFQFSLEEEISITRDLAQQWNRAEHSRIQICPAPLTLFLSGPRVLKAAKSLADDYEVPLHIHIAETSSEVDATLQDYGCREVELLDQSNVLDERFHVVHGVWLDQAEMDLLARKGSHVIHCPTSNMSLASGVASVVELIAQGVNVALASDGIGNYNHDMFSVMKAALLMQRVQSLRPDAITPAEILEMATLGGARALGLEYEIGSLEAGKKADVILLNLHKPHLVPLYDLPTAIVTGANPSDVDTVIVDGQIVMDKRQVKTLNEAVIVDIAQQIGNDLVRRAKLS